MKAHIVIDLGFGDSGKGIVTARLVQAAQKNNEKVIVVRQNGGHQAGHTVYSRKHKSHHVFSQFGSGAYTDASTYLPDTFTFCPEQFVKEREIFNEAKTSRLPKVYIDAEAMLVTPWDKYANQIESKATQHGTVGVGFGTTIVRNEKHYNLYARDLQFPTVLKQKLESIITNYYGLSLVEEQFAVDRYLEACAKVLDLDIILSNNFSHLARNHYDTVVFESAQGTLLDQHYGFFPNVTRSDTTVKAVYDFILKAGIKFSTYNVHYVTRSYLTRHGAGFLPEETRSLPLSNTNHETNKTNEWQGELRYAPINYELLRYAITTNEYYIWKIKCLGRRTLIITCCDQCDVDPEEVYEKLKRPALNYIFKSYSPHLEDDYVPYRIEDRKLQHSN